MISHNNYYSCLFVITDNSDYQQVIEIINKQCTTVGGTDVQWWGKEWVHGYMWMACNKSRIAIRVSNLCRPHVNAKCLNDVRKSDNQARPWRQWICIFSCMCNVIQTFHVYMEPAQVGYSYG